MKILSFGEILLRLASPGYTRLFQKDNLEATFCGGEANVAVSLSLLGLDSKFVTKLPEGSIGTAAANSLRYFGVDVSEIVYGEGRMGLYYLEKGASQRPSKVIYDRKYSAVSLADRKEFEWEKLFKDVLWFHWTGIDPALSDNMAEITYDACRTAKNMGITVSCDLNYRSSLWSEEKAKSVMSGLMPFVDVCIANEEDADKVLGICSKDTDVQTGKLNKAGYQEVAAKICERYGCKKAAITLRESYSASRNGWSGMLYDTSERTSYYSKHYDINIIDRVGGGDSFTAGIIFGIVSGKSNQDIVDFAAAASCLKHSIEGDYNRVTVEEVEQLLRNGGSGRVQR